MSIETLVPTEQIPQAFKDFDSWMQAYIHQHQLVDEDNYYTVSVEEFDCKHFPAFQAKATELGLCLERDGALFEMRRQ